MFNKKPNKEILEMMNELMYSIIQEGINGECEVTLKCRPNGGGVETHLNGDTMTIIITLIGTLKQVMADVNGDNEEDNLEVVKMLWDVIGRRKEELK